jgi:hypothetical protein
MRGKARGHVATLDQNTTTIRFACRVPLAFGVVCVRATPHDAENSPATVRTWRSRPSPGQCFGGGSPRDEMQLKRKPYRKIFGGPYSNQMSINI